MKRAAAIALTVAAMFTLTACTDEDGNWITPNVHTVTLPDGSEVVCVTAGDSSYAGIDCNW